jgi:hypothetical protein
MAVNEAESVVLGSAVLQTETLLLEGHRSSTAAAAQ